MHLRKKNTHSKKNKILIFDSQEKYIPLFFFTFSRKDKYKDATEMLNDKSEIKNCKNFYDKFNFVPDDEDDYNDEYDDTYDSCNIRTSGAIEDSTDTDVRPFTVPRVS